MKTSWSALFCGSLALMQGCAEFGQALKPSPAPAPAAAGEAARPAQPTREQLVRAFELLNKALQDANEKLLKERGTRIIPAPRSVAFDALQASLVRLGMIVENRDPDVGLLAVAAPAPRPLDASEWIITVRTDTPLMAKVVCPVIGEACKGLKFDPDDFVIVINATVAGAGGGSEVSLTTRMREIAPSPGMPRREYPPPTGVSLALDKIWARFDLELAERQRQAR
jgi:hypothetical protein